MKRLISLKLALILLLSSLSTLAPVSVATAATPAKKASSCENGECIEGLVQKLERLGKSFQNECLPKGIKESQIEKHFEENGLTEECWQKITEINHLEEELLKHQNRLEAKLGCESGECRMSTGESINAQLQDLAKTQQVNSCTPEKKQKVKNTCGSDLSCVLAASALGVGGYLAEMMLPSKMKPKGCNLGNDSCLTNLATGFMKSVITLFEGAWDLLKWAGKKTGEKMTQFWNWVTQAEDHSSTSQLAMAKASKDPGVFDMLTKDFSGTMKKMWEALVGSLKEWMKNDVFCQKWSGVPRFSKCLDPMDSFDCLSCKAMVTGTCAISGLILAEVVPAFLTGGLVTAAKYGIKGASKISKLYKVSAKSLAAIKRTKLGQTAVKGATKVDDLLKVSKGLQAAKTAITASLQLVSKYMLSPVRKAAKVSFSSLGKLLKKGTNYVADTAAGKILVFGGKSLKLTGKVILYPIDNPMTTMAFKAGERTFDKIFKLGAPKLVATSSAASKVIAHNDELEKVVVRIQEAKNKNRPGDVLALEEELVTKLGDDRTKVLKEALDDNNVQFEDVVRNIYPELQYTDLARKTQPERIIAAEKELYLTITEMSDGPAKSAMLQKYNNHVIQGEARAQVLGKSSPSYAKVVENSKLNSSERLEEALKVLERKDLSAAEKQKLGKALEEAHLIAPDNGVYEYSWRELREKYRILTDGGFTKDEADLLIRYGLAGRPPVRELIKPGDTLFSGFAEDIVDGKYLEKREELFSLIEKAHPHRKSSLRNWLAMTNNDAFKVKDNFDSLYFVDYSHNVPELENVLQGAQQVAKSNMAARYEQKAFDNFKEAHKYLLDSRPEISKETLLEVHKRMMKGGVENVQAADMGIIRDGHWYGNVPRGHEIDAKVVKELEANPYLTWISSGETTPGKFTGQIQYPNVDHVRTEGLDLIRKNHPDLVVEIEKYQTAPKQIKEMTEKLADSAFAQTDEGQKLAQQLEELKAYHAEAAKNKKEVTRKLVDAMTDDLMDWFTRERSLIGDINSPEKLDQYADLVAKFQRDLVSIHPVANGNGRSTRQLGLYYAMMKEGFPPPRILDTNADIYRSVDDWKKIIKHGILASDFLIDDAIERLRFGLPIENSVELITPYTRPPVPMALKGQKKVPTMDGVEYIDPRLYREIVKREMKANPALSAELAKNPVDTWDKIHKRVEEVYARNNLYYNHAKHGIERVELGFVDDDFKLLYGKSTATNKELYDFKMKTWYQDQITWRGLASKSREKTEAEIISMFQELSGHNASNAVVGKTRSNASPEAIRKAALEDFEKYNNDVFGDGLVQMARDHSETGPMYGISYGYSTSKNREVGKAFAMGAMVVGEYGAHKAPELQALLKSRVLVGARRAHKDVDLGRLKQVRDEFSYKYGRQQEVMGIGASDPDAITIVQTIDAEGGVMLSYLRNREKPDEIWVIKGAIEPDEVPSAEQIIKTVKLK